MKIENLYHEGALQVQERLGVLSEGENNAKEKGPEISL